MRIMSIHKSKGLEFPVVFVAGLGKLFNQQDVRSAFLKHKELGFGPRFVDPALRISYPTLPYLAIRRAMRKEMLAEEMRILYVALTRPKEKMFLVATVADADAKLKRWLASVDANSWIPDFRVAAARSFIDWLGPLAAMQMAEKEQEAVSAPQWRAGIVSASLFGKEAAAAIEEPSEQDTAKEERLQAVTSLSLLEGIEENEELRLRLEWQYPHQAAALLAAKTSVTEMKRLHAVEDEDAAPLPGQAADVAEEQREQEPSLIPASGYTFRLRRPAFMEEKSLTAAEKGSVNHLLMQHVPLTGNVDEANLKETLDGMIARRLMTTLQSKALDLPAVAAFFEGELGQRLLSAGWVRREVPFSCMFPASRVYPESEESLAQEPILIQGVIDCLFEDEAGIVLLDYKTDRISNQQWTEAAERHRFQLELYAEAIESVLGRKVDECHIFFLMGAVGKLEKVEHSI